jgi:hypothetical protein
MMPQPTAADVAAFMLQRLNEDATLYQDVVVSEIQDEFGEAFVYTNDNGNLAIDRKVLAEFRKLTDGKVVWNRGERFWRVKESFDNPDSRVADE